MGITAMSISKYNYEPLLARVKRHYNLKVDDFVVVDNAAMLLASTTLCCEYISIAVTPVMFDRLKTYTLPDCDVNNHIKLLNGVLCRRIQLPEIENRMWSGKCWTLTKEYLIKEREAILGQKTLSKNRQKQTTRELALLNMVGAIPEDTSNKAKALLRIRRVALYLGVTVAELFLCDQTIQCVQDNIKMDNDILVLGIDNQLWSKIIRNVTVPNTIEFFTNGCTYNGYELEHNTYVTTMPNALCQQVLNNDGPYHCPAFGVTYHTAKGL